MLDNKINDRLRPGFLKLAKLTCKLNISANFLTLMGFLAGLTCFFCIIYSNFLLAFFFLFLNRFLDGLDGAVARIQGKTDIGAFYDILSDFIFYSLYPIAFIFYNIDNAYSISFLLLSFVSTQTTFLASAWILEKNKLFLSQKNKKSFFYIGGIIEGFETIICFSLMLAFIDLVYLISYLFGTLCWITCVFRIYYIRKIIIA